MVLYETTSFLEAPGFLIYKVASFLVCVTLPLYGLGQLAFAALLIHTPAAAPRRLFGLTFAASGALLVLVLLEVWGALPPPARWLLWRLHLFVDIGLVVLLLPFVLLSLTLRATLGVSSTSARALALVPLAAWLWAFYKVGEPFPIMQDSAATWADWLSGSSAIARIAALCLSRAGVIGVSLSALLSGSGAVNGPATSLHRLMATVDARELDEAKRGVLHALQLLSKHRLRLRAFARRVAAHQRKDAQSKEAAAGALVSSIDQLRLALGPGGGSIRAALTSLVLCGLARARLSLPLFFRAASYREAAAEQRVARREDAALRAALRKQLVAFEQLLDDRQRAAFAMTPRGRLYNVLGYVFSVYCIYKVSMATRSILKQGTLVAAAGAATIIPAPPGGAAAAAAGGGSKPVPDRATLSDLIEYWHASSHEASVTRALGIALRLSLLEEGVVGFWSQGVSLLMTGIMIFSSVRAFLVQASRVAVRIELRVAQRRLAKEQQARQRQLRKSKEGGTTPTASPAPAKLLEGTSGAPDASAVATKQAEDSTTLADLIGCLAAQLMGFYFLSSVLLMRASLPHEFRKGISEIGLGETEFHFYHHWFDSLFLAAAVITLALLALQRAARRQRRRQSAGETSFGRLAAPLRHHYAVKASAHRQRADGTERLKAEAAANRAPVISTPPRSGLLTSPGVGGDGSHHGGSNHAGSLYQYATPPHTPTQRRASKENTPQADRRRPLAGGIISMSRTMPEGMRTPEPPASPVRAHHLPPPPSPTLIPQQVSALSFEPDEQESPTASQGAHGGKAAQDAVAELAAEAAAAAAFGPQALVDFAAARLAALDDAAGCEGEEGAKEA